MTFKNQDMIVSPESSLKHSMAKINSSGSGTVFVADDGELLGVATDGDIRRGILSGIGIEEPIKQVMNDEPLYVHDSWSDGQINKWAEQSEVREKLPQHKHIVVPVVDDKKKISDFITISKNGKIAGQSNISESDVEKVLIIGGAGYIGSVLAEMLLDQGYVVTVLDNLLYGDHSVRPLLSNENFTLIEGDMRSIETVMEAISGVEAVVHLAGLVGDPASSIDAKKTLELNYHSVKMVAEICKYHQVNRFIFASTCSVYGRSESPDKLLTEESPLNPVSLYAKTKLESERALLNMRDGNFSPTIFRKATVYGLSPRMRFDLVVNILSAKAHNENTIPIFGGEQYRPNVHVADVAQAYIDCLEAPIADVDGEIFNVGSNEQNYQIKEIGEIVSECFPHAEIDHQHEKEDERSYQVDFCKIEDTLNYEATHSISDACLEIKEAFNNGVFDDYTEERFSNYQTLENNGEIFDDIEARG